LEVTRPYPIAEGRFKGSKRSDLHGGQPERRARASTGEVVCSHVAYAERQFPRQGQPRPSAALNLGRHQVLRESSAIGKNRLSVDVKYPRSEVGVGDDPASFITGGKTYEDDIYRGRHHRGIVVSRSGERRGPGIVGWSHQRGEA
jgi:hypothetical protein